MSKFDPLRDWLRSAPDPVTLTFVQVANLVGGLSQSAYKRPEWWENHDNRHVQASAWHSAGRRVVGNERSPSPGPFDSKGARRVSSGRVLPP